MSRHCSAIALGPTVAAGAPITHATCDGDPPILSATGQGDEEVEVDEIVWVCEACLVRERPKAAWVLAAAREQGSWEAEDE